MRPSGGSATPTRLDSDYVVEATFHRIDLTRFAPVGDLEKDNPKSFVSIDQTDIIRKNSTRELPFSLPMYTTGLRMEHQAITNSVEPGWTLGEPGGGENRKPYEFVLPIGNKPIDHSEVIRNRYTYVNGFRDAQKEWWIASVKYPTTALAVYFEFPEGKPCRKMTAYRQRGISQKERIPDNPPTISSNGRNAYWIGANEKPESRIHFEWDW